MQPHVTFVRKYIGLSLLSSVLTLTAVALKTTVPGATAEFWRNKAPEGRSLQVPQNRLAQRAGSGGVTEITLFVYGNLVDVHLRIQ